MKVTPASQNELDGRDAELQALRARVAQLEAELADQAASANAHIAATQRRMYWLDRLELDLNATFARRGVAPAVTVPLKVLRRVRREIRSLRVRLAR